MRSEVRSGGEGWGTRGGVVCVFVCVFVYAKEKERERDYVCVSL